MPLPASPPPCPESASCSGVVVMSLSFTPFSHNPLPAMKLVAAVASPAQWLWAVSELGLAGDAHGGLRPSLAGPCRPPNPARPWQVLESRPLTTPHGDLFPP